MLARGQGGLLDVAVSPTFAEDRIIYWTYAKPVARGSSPPPRRAAGWPRTAHRVTDVQDVFVQDPPSPTTNHYGSRVVPDGAGHLFITTGEHFNPGGAPVRPGSRQDLRQDRPRQPRRHPARGQSLRRPADAVPTIWSLGHRNIQGAALDADGQLWAVEHGPKGGDELNRIEPGANYGWPVISYGENYDGSPVGEGITAARGAWSSRATTGTR